MLICYELGWEGGGMELTASLAWQGMKKDDNADDLGIIPKLKLVAGRILWDQGAGPKGLQGFIMIWGRVGSGYRGCTT